MQVLQSKRLLAQTVEPIDGSPKPYDGAEISTLLQGFNVHSIKLVMPNRFTFSDRPQP